MQQILYNMVNLVFTNYLFFLFHAANIIGSIYSITRIYVISMLHLRVGFISLFPRYFRNRIHEISFANRCRFVGKREDYFYLRIASCDEKSFLTVSAFYVRSGLYRLSSS